MKWSSFSRHFFFTMINKNCSKSENIGREENHHHHHPIQKLVRVPLHASIYHRLRPKISIDPVLVLVLGNWVLRCCFCSSVERKLRSAPHSAKIAESILERQRECATRRFRQECRRRTGESRSLVRLRGERLEEILHSFRCVLVIVIFVGQEAEDGSVPLSSSPSSLPPVISIPPSISGRRRLQKITDLEFLVRKDQALRQGKER